MINKYLQQWTTIQTVRAARFSIADVWLSYLSVGGDQDEIEIAGYLAGVTVLSTLDRDLLAHAINQIIADRDVPVDGAHYSTDLVAYGSGFADMLRRLTLSPEGYRFDRPARTEPAGIASDGGTPARQDRVDEDEDRRCRALFETGLLETGAETRFDRLTSEAREHFGVSSASIALITEDRQIIKSVVGPIGQDLPRDTALCSRTIQADRTLVIPDAAASPEFRNHPLVTGAPHIRFYAGHPICSTTGWRIGTLCLIDDRPRPFSDADERDLRLRAAQVQIEVWLGPSDA
ncbi:GAF domain-containing protein [Arthrobacter sp. B0490]|uniref:GAF domain-containing protein n=1 Tax=Arthrobacter sp. B0490 TaxID=2058891 RepID=UPI000CE4E12B|nr:GAF domain-containing protein [Arthrobacter sp. B0490]